MASNVVRSAAQALETVRPIFSKTPEEARLRVLKLYKAWYRTIPYLVTHYDVCITTDIGRKKLREIFQRNTHLRDIRTIDMLVIKGQMELQEVVNKWTSKGMIMRHLGTTPKKTESDFMSKFLAGKD